MDTSDWIAVAALGVSVVIGPLSWWQALRSARASIVAADAANRSALAAEDTAAIDRDRRHTELTPQVDVSCLARGDDHARLVIKLTGPSDIDLLDEVSVTIRDDHPRGESQIAGGPTADQVARVVWGPYRLTPNVNGADSIGRSLPPRSIRLGDSLIFALERTLPPTWYDDHASWRRQYDGAPVRLDVICRRSDEGSWVIPVEVDVSGHPMRIRWVG